jgi:hypothetical protein
MNKAGSGATSQAAAQTLSEDSTIVVFVMTAWHVGAQAHSGG